MFATHPKTSQPTLASRAQRARQAQALTYTPREQEILHARRTLEPHYTAEELDAMPPARLVNAAEALEDSWGQARTGLSN